MKNLLFLFLIIAGSCMAQTTWSINPQVGSISASGLYTAPADVPVETVVTISAAGPDGVKKTVGTVTLMPKATTVLQSSATKQFAAPVILPPPGTQTSYFVSDLQWISMANGWGPVEKDRSNGENAAGDGATLKLGTVTYAKGLGAHAPSNVRYSLAGKCSTFKSDVGIDNEIRPNGSVIFQVLADGVKLYDSGKMTASTPTKQVNVDVTGKNGLELVITDAGDGINSDHGDWANALVQCSSSPTATVTQPPPTTSTGLGCGSSCVASGPIVSSGQTDRVISNVKISNVSGPCITVQGGTNITIKNVEFSNCTGEGVHAENVNGITIQDAKMDRVMSGAWILLSKRVVFQYNSVTNVQGPFPRGQMVQFDKVSGPGNRIKCNTAVNILGQSKPEDIINLYQSNGDPVDPIQVIGNKIQGGGPSLSGGGIMMGDSGGSYQTASDNILVDPGQYGMSIASGTNQRIRNNTIFARQQSFTNVGISVWNQYSTPCNSVSVAGNSVKWTNSAGASNAGWNAGNCGSVPDWGNNSWNVPIDASIWNNTIAACAR